MKDRIHVRLLIIDDDEGVCRRLGSWLTEERFGVETFTDVNAGLDAATRNSFDIAFLDLRPPDIDGAELVARVGAAPGSPRVIVMGAFPDPDEVKRALAAGARTLLNKPIHREELLAIVDQQLLDLGIGCRTEERFNAVVGARLREIRSALGKTQNEIAQLAGITAAQLSQIELGKTATSTWTLARICGALRVHISRVFVEAPERAASLPSA